MPFFKERISSNHLDVGVGTGYYLAQVSPPRDNQIAILDLNENCLAAASARLNHLNPKTIQHDILKPLEETDLKFDSISLFYLLHCLPGPQSRKIAVIEHLKHNLNPNGTLFGSTVIGKGVKFGYIGSAMLWWTNWQGVLDTKDDSLEGLKAGLKRNFHDVELRMEGVVCLFTCRRPKL